MTFWQNARMSRQAILLCITVLGSSIVHASAPGTYLTTEAFLAKAFLQPPAPRVLWIDESLRVALTKVLGHPPDALRMRYWAQDGRSAWIMDEIGKDKPITLGVVVRGDAIESLHVLVFRESRGWEIRHAFFTDQFRNARLDPDDRLTPHVDGITGATLSVNAARRVAAAALVLHHNAVAAHPDLAAVDD
jgi:hypothetical protein